MNAALVLEHAIDHVYREAKLAESENENEDFSITLRVLGLIREGCSGGPGLFDLACGYATGLPHGKYLFRRAARADFRQQQFLRLIPDYDYSNELPPADDPTDGRRRFYGNRFCNLAGEKLPRIDAKTTCSEDADFPPANRRSGSLEDADHRQPTQGVPRSAHLPGFALENRGVTQMRISSNAQKLWLQRRRDDAAYCGA